MTKEEILKFVTKWFKIGFLIGAISGVLVTYLVIK